MAMAARWKIGVKLITRRWETQRIVNRPVSNVRRWTAAEDRRCYSYDSFPSPTAMDMELTLKKSLQGYARKLKEKGQLGIHWSAGDMFEVDENSRPLTSDKDLAVSKAFEEYNKRIRIIKGDGESRGLHVLRVTSQTIAALKVFQVVFVGGERATYEFVCVAPNLEDLDDRSMKQVSLRKLDCLELTFDGLVGEINELSSPGDVTAAACFALGQLNKRDKVRLILKATSQMISGCEVLRMMFHGELSPALRYEAIVLVQLQTGNMDLVLLRQAYDPEGKYARYIQFG